MIADPSGVPTQRALIAALIAALSGYAVVRHGRKMMHEGIGLEDGGGWTAILIAEVLCCFSAVAAALA
jgi:hypothetical protein